MYAKTNRLLFILYFSLLALPNPYLVAVVNFKGLDQVGFEPTTYSLQASCSSNWSYKPIKVGVLLIRPLRSEFHIITHNEPFQLPTVKVVIIVATIGDCSFGRLSVHSCAFSGLEFLAPHQFSHLPDYEKRIF